MKNGKKVKATITNSGSNQSDLLGKMGLIINNTGKNERSCSEAAISINKYNFSVLPEILNYLISKDINLVSFVIDEAGHPLAIEKISQRISSLRYRFLSKLTVRARNIPYCLINQPAGVVYFLGKASDFIKPRSCKKCKYNLRCRGILKKHAKFFGTKKLKPIPDLPREVMIEIEPECNLDCEFCFNKNSFAENGRDIENKLTSPFIKKIIDSTVKAGIPMIRFTGGEPLLRKDIWALARYAKKKKLELKLNTNGILIENISIAKKITKYFDNILLPVQYSDILGRNKVAKAKLKAIKLLRQAEVKVLRVGTVATKEVIRNLNKVYKFIESLPIDKWELYRVIATPRNKNSFTKKNVADLVEGLLEIKQVPCKIKHINIINAIPFCSYDPVKVQAVAIGADAVDGHERLAVDPRGFAKPIYYMGENIGDSADILACWNHPFMKKMRNLKFVPKECKNCIFLEKCRGGCRFSAYTVNGSYKAPDPLMNQKNIIYI